MKFLTMLCLALAMCLKGYAQLPDTCLTQQEIINIANNIKELQETVYLQDQLIDELKHQVNSYEALHNQDTLLISYLKEHIALLNARIENYKDLVKAVKPKWYERRFFVFVGGMGTMVLSSWIVSNVK